VPGAAEPCGVVAGKLWINMQVAGSAVGARATGQKPSASRVDAGCWPQWPGWPSLGSRSGGVASKDRAQELMQ